MICGRRFGDITRSLKSSVADITSESAGAAGESNEGEANMAHFHIIASVRQTTLVTLRVLFNQRQGAGARMYLIMHRRSCRRLLRIHYMHVKFRNFIGHPLNVLVDYNATNTKFRILVLNLSIKNLLIRYV